MWMLILFLSPLGIGVLLFSIEFIELAIDPARAEAGKGGA